MFGEPICNASCGLALPRQHVDGQRLGEIGPLIEPKIVHGARVVSAQQEHHRTGPQARCLHFAIEQEGRLAALACFVQQARIAEHVAQDELRVGAVRTTAYEICRPLDALRRDPRARPGSR